MIDANLKNIANVVLFMTCMLLISTGYGLYTIFNAEQKRTMNTNTLTFYITSVFSDSYYWKIMAASTIGYGIIFAFLSQIFIYRNDVSFIQQGVNIPSISVTPWLQRYRLCANAFYLFNRSFFDLIGTY